MKAHVVIATMLIAAGNLYGSVTEKLQANCEKIAACKQDVKSGDLKNKCGSNCRGGCQKCRSCSVA